MTIDKSWTTLANRNCPEFFSGLDAFLERCKDHLSSSKTCRCPCENCDNHVYAPLSTLRVHIHRYGFSESYTTWRFHGEKFVMPAAHADLGQTTDELHDYLNDVRPENTANEHNTVTDKPIEGSSNTSRSDAQSRPTERLYTLAEVDAIYASQLSQLRAQHSQLQEQLRAQQMQTNALYEALRQAGINVNLPSFSQPFPSTNLVNDEEVLTTSQMKDKIEENGSRKFPIPCNMLTSVDGGSTTDSIKDKAPIVGNTDLTPKVTAEPPQKKPAFQMSVPEDSFEIDDDIHDNGHVSFPSAEISKPEASLVANKPAAAADIIEASKPAEVPRTPALVENNKPVFPEVTKVQEESELKEAKNAASSPKSDVGIFGGSVSGQGIGFKLPTSPPSATTAQTSVVLQSTLEKEKVAPEKDSNSFSFGTGVEKVSPVQFYANESSESQQNASSDPKAHDSISVFNSVAKNDHLKFSAPSKDEIGNDQKSANMFGKSIASAVPAATSTSGSFLFGNPTTTSASSPLAFSSSASVANTNLVHNNSPPNVTSASTATTTAGAIFSTSVPTSVFGFGSVTSTSSTTSITETGNSNAINEKEPKLNMTTSPFATSLATTTTTAGSGLFGFSSPAAASTTTTTGSGLFGFSSPAATSTTTTTLGSGLFGLSSPAATSTTTTGSGLFGFSSSAATSTTTTTGNGHFGFSSPAATSTTTTTATRSGLFGFSSPAPISTTTTAQSQGSFFNIASGSQANTQAYAAVSLGSVGKKSGRGIVKVVKNKNRRK